MAPEWSRIVVPQGQQIDPAQLEALREKAEDLLDEIEQALEALADAPSLSEVLKLANLLAPGDPLTRLDDIPSLLAWIYRRPISWIECDSDEVAVVSLEMAPDEDFLHDFDRCIISVRPDLRHLLPESKRDPFDTEPLNPRFDAEPVAEWVQIGSDQDGHGFLFFDRTETPPRFIKVHNDEPDFHIVEHHGCEALLIDRILPDIVSCVRFGLEEE